MISDMASPLEDFRRKSQAASFVVIRHLSKYVRAFFCELGFCIHLASTRIAQGRCGSGENGAERRASLGQCRQILVLVIRYAILPAAKHDANPFEGQSSHRSMVVLAPLALLLVIGPGPQRLRNRVSRPFVKHFAAETWHRPSGNVPISSSHSSPSPVRSRCVSAPRRRCRNDPVGSRRPPTSAAPRLPPLPAATRR